MSKCHWYVSQRHTMKTKFAKGALMYLNIKFINAGRPMLTFRFYMQKIRKIGKRAKNYKRSKPKNGLVRLFGQEKSNSSTVKSDDKRLRSALLKKIKKKTLWLSSKRRSIWNSGFARNPQKSSKSKSILMWGRPTFYNVSPVETFR